MKKQYAYDEICIAAAFMKIPYLYGIPSGILQTEKRGYVSIAEREHARNAAILLRDRVNFLVDRMCSHRLLFIDASGIIHMDEDLHAIIHTLGNADRMGYVAFLNPKKTMRLYCYKAEDKILLQTSDGKGGGKFYLTKDQESFRKVIQKYLKKMKPDLMTGVMAERKNQYFEKYMDKVWKDDEINPALEEQLYQHMSKES